MHPHACLSILPSNRCVICGAEPIRTEVMHSFFEYFRPSGFNPKALMPAYGLAEFTLCATSQPSGRELNILHVDQQVHTSACLLCTVFTHRHIRRMFACMSMRCALIPDTIPM